MRLFAPSEIQTVKAKERKMEIDQGMTLAKRVDALRLALATEEAALHRFRTENVGIVRDEIAATVVELEETRNLLALARSELAEARKPLDAEWELLKDKQADRVQELTEMALKTLELYNWEQSLALEQKALTGSTAALKQASTDLELKRKDIDSLHREKEGELAQIQALKRDFEQEYNLKLTLITEKERTLDYDIKHHQDYLQELTKKEHELSIRERRLTIRENVKRKN